MGKHSVHYFTMTFCNSLLGSNNCSVHSKLMRKNTVSFSFVKSFFHLKIKFLFLSFKLIIYSLGKKNPLKYCHRGPF